MPHEVEMKDIDLVTAIRLSSRSNTVLGIEHQLTSSDCLLPRGSESHVKF